MNRVSGVLIGSANACNVIIMDFGTRSFDAVFQILTLICRENKLRFCLQNLVLPTNQNTQL